MSETSNRFPPSSLDRREFKKQLPTHYMVRLLLVFLCACFTLLNAQAAIHAGLLTL